MQAQGSKRRVPRLFLDQALNADRIDIGERETHYIGHVLRLKRGDELVVFNGRGQEFSASIGELSRRRSRLELLAALTPLPEPSLQTALIQALVKSDAMDTIVQKATELGIAKIIAVRTSFSVVKLGRDRIEKRLNHWQRVARGACEQSGRHRPPEIVFFDSLEICMDTMPTDGLRIAFHPGSRRKFSDLSPTAENVTALIGPEGGLSPADLEIAARAGFERIDLGPRILRADTAAIAACSAIQLRWA